MTRTDIVVVDGNREFKPAKYNAMRQAIADCATIDDCMEAQSQAAAMAVYYKQVNDKESWRKLNEIRLRAWRRMSEIISSVDTSKCRTQKAMAALVRDTLGESATAMLTDHRILQLIKLAGVPDRNFEAELPNVTSDSIDALIRAAHPDEIKRQEQERKRAEQSYKTIVSEVPPDPEKMREQARKAKAEADLQADVLIKAIKEKAIMEAPEVGLTLTPKAQANLVSFSVMMDRKMHDQLRDAAHERRTTMWAILREAANYWFVVNGYDKV